MFFSSDSPSRPSASGPVPTLCQLSPFCFSLLASLRYRPRFWFLASGESFFYPASSLRLDLFDPFFHSLDPLSSIRERLLPLVRTGLPSRSPPFSGSRSICDRLIFFFPYATVTCSPNCGRPKVSSARSPSTSLLPAGAFTFFSLS